MFTVVILFGIPLAIVLLIGAAIVHMIDTDNQK